MTKKATKPEIVKFPALSSRDKTRITHEAKMYEALMPAFTGQYADKQLNSGEYYAIPYRSGAILSTLERIHKTKIYNSSFIDVGGGKGNIALCARRFFYNCTILENNVNYVQQLRQSAVSPGCEIIEADALEYKDYGKYDIIYSYNIFSNRKLWEQLVEILINQAKSGAILILIDVSGAFNEKRIFDLITEKCYFTNLKLYQVFVKK